MNFKISITAHVKSQFESTVFPDQAIKDLFNNFISIAKGKYFPDLIQSLPGKFKPSWEANISESSMRVLFLKKAEEYGMHHYHIGYKFYDEGQDPHYDGKVSDGIVHLLVNDLDGSSFEMRLIDICLEHPSPFKLPLTKAGDSVVEDIVPLQ